MTEEARTWTVERLGHRGDGVATGPDGPIHVRRALPGEVVAGQLVDGRIDTPRILTPSPDRVTPPCRHARQCGGCTLQHMADGALAAWKQDIVRAALLRVGLDPPFRPIVTSPPASRRRATFSARRTKAGALIGFHAAASDTIVDGPDCCLVVPGILAARPALAELVRLGGTRKSELAITATLCPEGLDVAVRGGRALDAELRAALGTLAAETSLVRITWDGEAAAQIASPTVCFDGLSVRLPPGGFLQATESGERTLREAVTEIVAGAGRIVDLFAGCGTFALPAARHAKVRAFESDPEAVAALNAGWRGAGGLHRLEAQVRDLFRNPLLAEELAPFDAAVIDPPRAGAAAQTAQITESTLRRVAMVSCNPASFARDAATLARAGFEIAWVQVVDQFRWSPHVELVAAAIRDAGQPRSGPRASARRGAA